MTLLETLQHLERLLNEADTGIYEPGFTDEEHELLFEAFVSMTGTINESVEIITNLEEQVAELTKEIEEKNKIWTP